MELEQQFNKLGQELLVKFRNELPAGLHYHNMNHTWDDVLPAAEFLATKEGVSGDDLTILRTAVLFHDIGFIEQYLNNEPIGVHISASLLPDYDYTPDQITRVKNIILATEVPQTPKNLLEEIICDADLDSLGRDDFFTISMNLWREICHFSEPLSLLQWFEGQKTFLSSHKYFTNSSRELREPGKQANLAEIELLLAGPSHNNSCSI
jgi:predicted metal-dependent HD superfamily phosphohydrolase